MKLMGFFNVFLWFKMCSKCVQNVLKCHWIWLRIWVHFVSDLCDIRMHSELILNSYSSHTHTSQCLLFLIRFGMSFQSRLNVILTPLTRKVFELVSAGEQQVHFSSLTYNHFSYRIHIDHLISITWSFDINTHHHSVSITIIIWYQSPHSPSFYSHSHSISFSFSLNLIPHKRWNSLLLMLVADRRWKGVNSREKCEIWEVNVTPFDELGKYMMSYWSAHKALWIFPDELMTSIWAH